MAGPCDDPAQKRIERGSLSEKRKDQNAQLAKRLSVSRITREQPIEDNPGR